MRCIMCKGKLEDKSTTFMIELDNSIVIVKNVPSQVCSQCGEISYTHEVATQLERITKQARTSITEIAVVHYSDNVA